MRKLTGFLVAALIMGVASPVNAQLSIEVGTIYLQPNTPNQVVELYVTGGTEVAGVNLVLLVANGGPEFEELLLLDPGEGILGPAMTSIDILTDTIFADNNIGQFDALEVFELSQAAEMATITAAGTVTAEGLLARITFDTTGLTEGSFPLHLTLQEDVTHFQSLLGDVIPVDLTDGLLIVGDAPPPPPPPPPPGDPVLVANAGEDRQAVSGDTVVLSASVANPTDAAVTLKWTQISGPEVTLDNDTILTPAFLAPAVVTSTLLTFKFEASDGTNTSEDTVDITVEPSNTVLTANAGPDQNVQAGAVVQLNGAGGGPVGVELAYAWTQLSGPAVTLSNDAIAAPTFVAPSLNTANDLEFELEVSAGSVAAVDTVIIHVAAKQSSTGSPGSNNGSQVNDETNQNKNGQQSPMTIQSFLLGMGLLLLGMFLLYFLFWLL